MLSSFDSCDTNPMLLPFLESTMVELSMELWVDGEAARIAGEIERVASDVIIILRRR